jgi:hypothetical protein
MRQYCLLLLLVIVFCVQCDTPALAVKERSTPLPKHIPSSLITKIKNLDSKDELESHAILDSLLFYTPDIDISHGALKPLFIDLDSDWNNEIILEITEIDYKYLTVLQQQSDGWHLIFGADFWQKYNVSGLKILNTNSREKIFCMRGMTASGTDLFAESTYFYKLIGDSIHCCLELTTDMHINDWNRYWNQSFDSEYTLYEHYDKDALEVEFSYSFTPNFPFQEVVNLDSLEDNAYFSDSDWLTFEWDSVQKQYIPQLDQLNPTLDSFQWSVVQNLSSDSLIYVAFESEIESKIKTGSITEQKMAELFKKAMTTSSED